MSDSDGGASRLAASESGSKGRHVRVAVGVTAVAAVLGAAAYVTTDRLTREQGATTEVGALAWPSASVGIPSAGVRSAPASASATPANGEMKPWASMSPEEQRRIRQKIDAAHKAMAKDGVKITRPLDGKKATGDAITRTGGSLSQDEGITRVTTAKYDLTGQKELRWVVDGGKKTGTATCTQKFRFSRDKPATERPNMLMCWRTSAQRSVVAVTVVKEGKPSTEANLKVLAREWGKLG
ncbi:hypothetical protein [Paractinoplanes rishiriensis]|uniref:Uncharacterized protein n=1 Tax=Paractinoplanes rishiriensis TaxID=1050105 RepID=A0A919JTJ8_9ACTN|nr:hypothetical protein [Actinoplanes rishiriensis]GIE92928.1 hypothetical protein Ari01nite_03930 [Actinoplanes rishiriensis]